MEATSPTEHSEIEQTTGDLYSDCFARLNNEDKHWFAHGRLLAQQLGIDRSVVAGKKCLDGGCANGTMTYQFLAMGAASVTGVDLHPIPKEKVFDEFAGKVNFAEASLLELPFPDATFDVVASTGVLQHTANPEKALSELIRVLKPGNTLYLGVYGRFGLFSWCLWVARLFTVKLPIIPQLFVDKVIEMLGLGPLVRYQILDYLYVPNLDRFTPKQLKGWFTKYGMKNPRRIYNVTPNEASEFRGAGTVYTYDPRTLWNKILFGYGFINMHADK
jgi:ubiquinone/menaquinone biosynthesis C-methylase UbiE